VGMEEWSVNDGTEQQLPPGGGGGAHTEPLVILEMVDLEQMEK
jgi:hypothetical protein